MTNLIVQSSFLKEDLWLAVGNLLRSRKTNCCAIEMTTGDLWSSRSVQKLCDADFKTLDSRHSGVSLDVVLEFSLNHSSESQVSTVDTNVHAN